MTKPSCLLKYVLLLGSLFLVTPSSASSSRDTTAATSASSSPLSNGPWGPTNPVAHPDAVVVHDDVRFTVLTDRMIRVERRQNATFKFEDRKTVAVINRQLPVPSFDAHVDPKGNILTIHTDCLELTYHLGQPFRSDTLFVTGTMYKSEDLRNAQKVHTSSSSAIIWTYRYGDVDPDNLLGTIRTLDVQDNATLNCSLIEGDGGPDDHDHCEWGLISKSGSAIINDTLNYALSDQGDWWDGPNTNVEDFYLLGHGHAYVDALADYRKIGGFIPLIPRYALGVWFSRWYNYNPVQIQEVVSDYELQTVPLDVWVLDMNWHRKDDWTGYSWDPLLFSPKNVAVAYPKARGLAVTLNLHDANGVNPWEDQYPALCDVLGHVNHKERVNFSITNATVAYALEDVVLQPLEGDTGVDFWWIDWQQGEKGPGGAEGGKQNPTIWTAHMRCTNANRRGQDKRNMVLARWGGLGAHRYPVHFSGDVAHLSWDDLAYQPYFSMAATNVGAIWSHDIEGPAQDLELYTRWIQWGVLSGVMRSHDRGMSAGNCANQEPETCAIDTPWAVPTKYRNANLQALRLRGALIPYLYTAAHHAHKYGRWFVTPLYYEWPELEGAYDTAKPRWDSSAKYELQYLFGDDLMVAPVVKPANTTDGLARLTLWIPPGIWIGMVGGQVLKGTDDGSSTHDLAVDLNEMPIFIRAGAVIPTIPVQPGATIGLAMKPYDEIIWTVGLAQGAPTSGSGVVYEDDGSSTAYYTKGAFATTTAKYSIATTEHGGSFRGNGGSNDADSAEMTTTTTMTFTVSTKGTFDKLPNTRATTIRLMNTAPPSSVEANGATIPYNRFGGKGTWTFDSKDAAVVIQLNPSSVHNGVSVTIRTASSASNGDELDLDGLGYRIRRATATKTTLDEIRRVPGSQTGQTDAKGYLNLASSSGSTLEFLAGGTSESSFHDVVTAYDAYFDGAIQELRSLHNSLLHHPTNATGTSEKRKLHETHGKSRPSGSDSGFEAPLRETSYRLAHALALLETV